AAASPGATSWVAAGPDDGPFVMRKRLVLFGEGGPSATILDGRDSTRVLHIEGVKNAAILGFRIRGGKAAGGSGLYCLRDTAIIIGSCEIRDNWEAGVSLWQSGPIQIADTEISSNHGTGLTASDSRLQLLHATFRENHGASGGAFSLDNSELYMARDCTFESNRADGGTGGAIFADSSIVRLQNCSFRENTAAAGGGAVAVMDSADLRIRNSYF